jgi:hypothetical protein
MTEAITIVHKTELGFLDVYQHQISYHFRRRTRWRDVFLRVVLDPLVGTFLETRFIRIVKKENVQQLPFVATTIKHRIQKHGRFTFVFGNAF